MDNIIQSAKQDMRTTQRDQNRLYNEHVLSKMNKGARHETIGKDYQKYITSLNGFHALAFDNVIRSILADDDKVINQFSKGFKNVSDYIGKRSVWNIKMNEILQGDSPSHIKQQAVDSLDRSRTRSHNGVIDLFNNINQYAEENKLANPYPISYSYFDKDNKNHRSDVADILTRHTTLLEKVNEIVLKDAPSS